MFSAVNWGAERLTDVLGLIKFTYSLGADRKCKQIMEQMKSCIT